MNYLKCEAVNIPQMRNMCVMKSFYNKIYMMPSNILEKFSAKYTSIFFVKCKSKQGLQTV